MVSQIALACLLIGQIALGGVCFTLYRMIEEMKKTINIHNEWLSTATHLFENISAEQDKHTAQIGVTEERVLNLQNKTGQISIQIKKLANNAVYEADNG